MKKNIIVAKKLIRLANEIVEAESTNLYRVIVEDYDDRKLVEMSTVKSMEDAILFIYIFALMFPRTRELAEYAEEKLSGIDVDKLDENAKSKIENYLYEIGYTAEISPLVVTSREDLEKHFQESYKKLQTLKGKEKQLTFNL